MCENYKKQCNAACDDPSVLPEPCDLQKSWMLGHDVMSGHFFFGTHLFYPKTFYITQLRHPITAFVSARMYVPQKRGQTVQTIAAGVELLEDFFQSGQYRKGGVPYRVDFMMRLLGKTPTAGADMEALTADVIDNLSTNFGVVGLTEHWNVTLRLIQANLDMPGNLHFWDLYEEYVSNSAYQPFSTSDLVRALPPRLMERIEEYTKYESEIFYRARDIMFYQCLEKLDPASCSCITKQTTHYPGQKRGIAVGERYIFTPNRNQFFTFEPAGCSYIAKEMTHYSGQNVTEYDMKC